MTTTILICLLILILGVAIYDIKRFSDCMNLYLKKYSFLDWITSIDYGLAKLPLGAIYVWHFRAKKWSE